MIEELATVVAIDANNITIESEIKSACGSCQQLDNCGSGQVAKAFPQKKMSAVIKSDLPVKVGDSVLIAVSEQALLSASWQVYCMPLIGLIMFAGFGQWLIEQYQFTELISVLFSMLGGYLGFVGAQYWQKRPLVQQTIQPIIVKILNSRIAITEVH